MGHRFLLAFGEFLAQVSVILSQTIPREAQCICNAGGNGRRSRRRRANPGIQGVNDHMSHPGKAESSTQKWLFNGILFRFAGGVSKTIAFGNIFKFRKAFWQKCMFLFAKISYGLSWVSKIQHVKLLELNKNRSRVSLWKCKKKGKKAKSVGISHQGDGSEVIVLLNLWCQSLQPRKIKMIMETTTMNEDVSLSKNWNFRVMSVYLRVSYLILGT